MQKIGCIEFSKDSLWGFSDICPSIVTRYFRFVLIYLAILAKRGPAEINFHLSPLWDDMAEVKAWITYIYIYIYSPVIFSYGLMDNGIKLMKLNLTCNKEVSFGNGQMVPRNSIGNWRLRLGYSPHQRAPFRPPWVIMFLVLTQSVYNLQVELRCTCILCEMPTLIYFFIQFLSVD